jgi:hypothetical protein
MASRARTRSLDRARGAEEGVGEAPVASIGLNGEDVLLGRIVQGVVEPGDHAGGIAERRMGRHVRDALPVDVDLASIPEALQILLTRKRPGGHCLRHTPPPWPGGLGFDPFLRRVPMSSLPVVMQHSQRESSGIPNAEGCDLPDPGLRRYRNEEFGLSG